MYIRLRRILQTGILLFSVTVRAGSDGSVPGMEVLYASEAVYVGKPLTFRFDPGTGAPPSVHTNGVDFALPPRVPGKPVEITLYPKRAARVLFRSGDEDVWRFDLVRPADPGPFGERDGFLERDGVPVVLLPDHRLPPPLDRRWETLAWVREKLFDGKSSLGAAAWVGPSGSTLAAEVKPLLGLESWARIEPDPHAWFRLHGYLMALKKPSADFLAVEVDFHDLDRGMPFHVWMAKWQFLLQRTAARSGYRDGLLIGPEFDEAHLGWKDRCTVALRSLAAAHGLRYVDRAQAPDVWKARLLDQLGKEYKLP